MTSESFYRVYWWLLAMYLPLCRFLAKKDWTSAEAEKTKGQHKGLFFSSSSILYLFNTNIYPNDKTSVDTAEQF